MVEKTSYQFFYNTAEAWDAMEKAIREANSSIYWETYIFDDGKTGRKFVEILKEKVRAGVEVRLILDGFGTLYFEEHAVREMRKSGIEVLMFNPVHLRSFWRGVRRWFERNHRKVLVVDQKIGFIGGVNVHQESFRWFDLHVRVTGLIVRHLLKAFARSYMAGGGLVEKVRYLMYLPVVKEKYLRVLWHKPHADFSSVKNVYLRAIKRAKDSLIIVSPYFLPDQEILTALEETKKRGVTIDLIVPLNSNHWPMTFAMRATWPVLHGLGIKIYLVRKMNHAKVMMADNEWAMVGSSNFDFQTLFRSHESNLVFTDPKMIEDLQKIFRTWRQSSKIFNPVEWEKRPWRWRVLEAICQPLRAIL